jgi:hypothetical protein
MESYRMIHLTSVSHMPKPAPAPLSFMDQYLQYIGESECPTFYHRWCCLSMVGAYIGRSYHLDHGHFKLHANLYVMLIGSPGARKSTAIKIAQRVIKDAGYTKISADRSSKEKFLLDLAGEEIEGGAVLDNILDSNLWGESAGADNEMYIACDEFNDFIGTGNIEFISMLGSLWDFNGTYKNRIKSGKSVSISDPTISILGGNTPVNFARAFPPEILGQGFFSRLLLIHGENTGRKITFPQKPSEASTTALVRALQQIKISAVGAASLPVESQKLLDKIYTTYKGIDDTRFESYTQRRFSHLLKLCLVISAIHYCDTILPEHIIEANTILTHTEHLMPSALGEFGKSKHSDVTHKVMQVLNGAYDIMSLTELWVHVHKDLDKLSELGEIIKNLSLAGRIVAVQGGFLAKRAILEEVNNDLLDYSYLTEEEREMKK